MYAFTIISATFELYTSISRSTSKARGSYDDNVFLFRLIFKVHKLLPYVILLKIKVFKLFNTTHML